MLAGQPTPSIVQSTLSAQNQYFFYTNGQWHGLILRLHTHSLATKQSNYHKQYCRCDVTGRSGRAVQRRRLSRFFLISSEMRMRVFSSLRSRVKPWVGSVSCLSHLVGEEEGKRTRCTVPQHVDCTSCPELWRFPVCTGTDPRLVNVNVRRVDEFFCAVFEFDEGGLVFLPDFFWYPSAA